MNLLELVTSAINALASNKLRSGLTMLGIIIGISSVILISSIGQGAVAFITEELSVFGTNYFQVSPGAGPFSSIGGSSSPITTKDYEALKRANIANIESIAPFAMYNGRVTANEEATNALVYGLTQDAQEILKPDVIYGNFIESIDDNSQAKVAVLGFDIAEELFGENTNPVGESIRIDTQRFRVIGVTKASGALTSGFFNNAINVPLSTMITSLNGVDELVEIDISVADENLLNQTIDEVELFLRDFREVVDGEDADFYIQSFKDSLSTIQTVTSLLTTMVVGISAISLLVGGVGVMNIMLVTVTERTKEIGLLKAIGAKEKDILTQFLIESITLTLLGGAVGISLGVLGAFLVSVVVNIPFVVSPVSVVLAVAVSSLVGLVFGLYPARRAAKLNPIEALRYE